LKLIK